MQDNIKLNKLLFNGDGRVDSIVFMNYILGLTIFPYYKLLGIQVHHQKLIMKQKL